MQWHHRNRPLCFFFFYIHKLFSYLIITTHHSDVSLYSHLSPAPNLWPPVLISLRLTEAERFKATTLLNFCTLATWSIPVCSSLYRMVSDDEQVVAAATLRAPEPVLAWIPTQQKSL